MTHPVPSVHLRFDFGPRQTELLDGKRSTSPLKDHVFRLTQKDDICFVRFVRFFEKSRGRGSRVSQSDFQESYPDFQEGLGTVDGEVD